MYFNPPQAEAAIFELEPRKLFCGGVSCRVHDMRFNGKLACGSSAEHVLGKYFRFSVSKLRAIQGSRSIGFHARRRTYWLSKGNAI
jgi:hypothetical protein